MQSILTCGPAEGGQPGPVFRESVECYVLSPHTEWEALWAYLAVHNFQLTDEQLLAEDGKHYVIPVRENGDGEAAYREVLSAGSFAAAPRRSGPGLLFKRHPLPHIYLQEHLRKEQFILTQLPDAATRPALVKKQEELCDSLTLLRETLVRPEDREMKQQLKSRLDRKTLRVPKGTRFPELAKQFSSGYTPPILLVTPNGILHELGAAVEEEGELRFLTIRDKAGYQSYERSAILLLLAAYHKLYGERSAAAWVDCKESGASRCRIVGKQTVTETELARLEMKMRALTVVAHPIEERSVPMQGTVRLFAARGMQDKAESLRFRIYSPVNLYRLGEYEDYLYGYMFPDSSYLTDFSLRLYEDGFMLRLPAQRLPV